MLLVFHKQPTKERLNLSETRLICHPFSLMIVTPGGQLLPGGGDPSSLFCRTHIHGHVVVHQPVYHFFIHLSSFCFDS